MINDACHFRLERTTNDKNILCSYIFLVKQEKYIYLIARVWKNMLPYVCRIIEVRETPTSMKSMRWSDRNSIDGTLRYKDEKK